MKRAFKLMTDPFGQYTLVAELQEDGTVIVFSWPEEDGGRFAYRRLESGHWVLIEGEKQTLMLDETWEEWAAEGAPVQDIIALLEEATSGA